MSVAGSICVRAVRDQQDVCLVAASHAVSAASPRRILDTLARGALADHGQELAALVRPRGPAGVRHHRADAGHR